MKRNKVSSKLTLENERMEHRLQVLKEMMSAEKARREVDGGIHWESGKPPGVLCINNNQNQILPSSLFTTPPTKMDPKKTIKVKFLNDKQDVRSDDKPLLRCGQCGQKPASLNCVECRENYCQVCYAKMHQKGAMAKHHVKPILNKVRPLPLKVDSGANIAPFNEEAIMEDPEVCATGETKGGSLLDGTYDEQGSAQSFQDAVKEWRNGRNVVVKSKETSVDSPRKASVTSGGVQAGEGLILPKKGIAFSFPDTNRISYFEKLILQRCRESPGSNPFLESTGDKRSDRLSLSTKIMEISSNHEEDKQEMEKEEVACAVSEYNIFYNDEDAESPAAESSNDTLPNFAGEVLIRDMTVSGIAPALSKINPNTEKKDASRKLEPAASKPVGSTKPNPKIRIQSKPANSKTAKLRGEKKTHSTKPKKSQDIQTDKERLRGSTVQLTEADLVRSVQVAWLKCDQESSRSQTLSAFFLHGVDPTSDHSDNAIKPFNLNTGTTQTTFKLGKSTWAPDVGTLEENKPLNAAHTSKLPSGNNRPDTKSEYRDPYYDDDGSDSEPENEREEFICSRLGHVPESTELGRVSRASTSNDHDLGKEEEDEEQLEWEQADYDALENLTSELRASTANSERSMTASRLEEEEETEQGGEESDEMLGDSFGEDLDMSRIQSDFDLFQRKLLDQDSD